MRQCWGDGDLRAHVDGELVERAQVAAHLELCAECSARYDEIAARAARVSKLMTMLPAAAPAMTPHRLPARRDHRRQWTAAAIALAAALAIAFVLLPKRGAVHPAPLAKAPAPLAVAPVAAAPVELAPPPVVRHAAARRPAVREGFLKLDDDPIETGVIVRVGAENGDVQADLIIGPDGRAHAIRVVSNQ